MASVQDWFEYMVQTTADDFQRAMEQAQDSPLDDAAILKDYQEWRLLLPSMCVKLGTDEEHMMEVVSWPENCDK